MKITWTPSSGGADETLKPSADSVMDFDGFLCMRRAFSVRVGLFLGSFIDVIKTQSVRL